MRYYGQSTDGVNMTYISSTPDELSIEVYTKETGLDGFLDTKLSEWLPYKGTFVCYKGIVYNGIFISEYAYNCHKVTEDMGIPAEFCKEYDEGTEVAIYVREENTGEKIAVKEIILIGDY